MIEVIGWIVLAVFTVWGTVLIRGARRVERGSREGLDAAFRAALPIAGLFLLTLASIALLRTGLAGFWLPMATASSLALLALFLPLPDNPA